MVMAGSRGKPIVGYHVTPGAASRLELASVAAEML